MLQGKKTSIRVKITTKRLFIKTGLTTLLKAKEKPMKNNKLIFWRLSPTIKGVKNATVAPPPAKEKSNVKSRTRNPLVGKYVLVINKFVNFIFSPY